MLILYVSFMVRYLSLSLSLSLSHCPIYNEFCVLWVICLELALPSKLKTYKSVRGFKVGLSKILINT